MFPYLLNVVYLGLLALFSPWLLWQAVKRGKYLAGWNQKFLGLAPLRDGDGFCVWLHAVSLGEVNLLASLIAELLQRRPDWQLVISTTTLTGYAQAQKKYPNLTVFYCPLDFSWAVRAALRRVRPRLLVLAELELWPNLVRAARETGAKVAVVNGRLSDRSFRGYGRIGFLLRRVLGRFDLIAAQDETYGQRFVQLGAPAEIVRVTGSMKYDGARTDRNNPATVALRRLAGISEQEIVFLAGSTQAPEEELALAAWRQLSARHPRLRLIIVPRHPERFDEVARLLAASGLPWARRSTLQPDQGRTQPPILLVDAVGELGAWWGTAAIAFVGGSLGKRGGQNMIEPAAYGAAVSFGPNTTNFRDIVAALLARDAAVVVRGGEEMTAFVRRCLEEPSFAEQLGENARSLVAGQLGATARTVDLLTALFESGEKTVRGPRRAA